jgi:hypothetical protein
MAFVPLEFDPSPERFPVDGFQPTEASHLEFGDSVADALSVRLRVAETRDAAFAA